MGILLLPLQEVMEKLGKMSLKILQTLKFTGILLGYPNRVP